MLAAHCLAFLYYPEANQVDAPSMKQQPNQVVQAAVIILA
jgi:hypothetical protein